MNQLAHPAVRLLAAGLDRLIEIFPIAWAIYYISQSTDLGRGLDASLMTVIALGFGGIVWMLIQPWFVARFGGGLGKILCGLAVVDNQGKHISYQRAFFRTYIGYFVSGVFFSLGFLWILVDKERKGWHDLAAETKVVVKNNQLWLLGLVAAVILSGATAMLGRQIMNNVQKNTPFFSALGSDIQTAASQFIEQIKNAATSSEDEE